VSNSYRIMLRAIIFIVSITLSCAIGVTVRAIRSYQHPRTISLCEVARDPGRYDQKTIRIRASSWVTSSDVYRSTDIFDTSCETGVAAASVELDNLYIPPAEVNAFLNSPSEEIRKADVIVLGKFDQWATMGCWTPQFGIRATSIELVSPVTSEPLPTIEPTTRAR